MLDAIEPRNDILDAVRRWAPDRRCLAAGDQHACIAVRCYAAGGLSDQQIVHRILDLLGVDYADTDRYSAAIAVARHCAAMDLPLRQIIAVLAYLAAEVPGSPDADDIASIAQAAVAEFAA